MNRIWNYLRGLGHDWDTALGVLVIACILFVPAGVVKLVIVILGVVLIFKPNLAYKATKKYGQRKVKK